MSTALTPVNLDQLPSTQLGSDEQFAELSRRPGFLERLQLFTKGDAINQGLVPPGTYGIPESKDRIIKLGAQIDVLPLARRTKALDMSEQTPIANYDATSDQFKDIAARSQESDRKVTRSACMARASWCSNAPPAASWGPHARPRATSLCSFR